jgi:hypothetical protein
MRARLIAFIGSLGLASSSWATPITFAYTGTGSGTLDGVAFGTTSFTITGTGDTTTTQAAPVERGFFIDDASATIAIAGLGMFDFVTPTRTFVNNDVGDVGFSRAGPFGTDLYSGPFIADPALFTWDMQSSIGPISGTFGLLQWDLSPVDTNARVLSFAASTGPGTFEASVVPVPSALILLVTALPLLALMPALRKRRATLR